MEVRTRWSRKIIQLSQLEWREDQDRPQHWISGARMAETRKQRGFEQRVCRSLALRASGRNCRVVVVGGGAKESKKQQSS
jgi:hypothetical protein